MNIFSFTQPAALIGRILDTKNPTVPLIQLNEFKPAYSIDQQGTPLPENTPENEGISSHLISSFLSKLSEDKTLNMHSVLILRHGKIVCRASFGAERTDVWKHTFSACKSITSLAIGMLIDDGLLSLSDHVVDLFPKETGPVAKIKLKDLTVENLLTMRSTLLFAEADSMTSTEWVRDFLNSNNHGVVGETFKYNSLNTYLLSAIVSKVTGKTMKDFLDERLFAPLGIVNYYWERSPEGIEKGGWGLFILPEDFAKIAIMVSNNGVYEGKRIISENYITLATSKHVEVTNESSIFNYGYQIWVAKDIDAYLFNGMLGQNVCTFRRNGIIVVSNAGNGELFQQSNYFKYLKEFFDRDFEDSLTENKKEYKELQRLLSDLNSYAPKKENKLLFWRKSDRKVYTALPDCFLGNYLPKKGDFASIGLLPFFLQAFENEYSEGFCGLSLEKAENDYVMTYREKNSVFVIPLGFKEPVMTDLRFGNNVFRVACSAKMKTDEDDREVLVLRLDFIETPSTRIIKFFFDDNSVTVKYTELPGEEFVLDSARELLREILEKPIISGFLDRFGDDIIEMKINRIISPVIVLKKE